MRDLQNFYCFLLTLPFLLAPIAFAETPLAARSCEELTLGKCRKLVREYEAKSHGNFPVSFTLYRTACEKGDAFACLRIGQFIKQQTLPADLSEARLVNQEMLETLRSECNSGEKLACFGDAKAHEKGIVAEKSPEIAFARMKASCAFGYRHGCVALGDYYGRGLGAPKSRDQAEVFFSATCGAEGSEGCFSLGFTHLGGYGGEKSTDKAFSYFRQSCEGGNAHGCSSLGWCFENGAGTGKSTSSAELFYREGCKLGHYDGCTNLARMHMSPEFFSPHRAIHFYERGCVMGNSVACAELAELYVTEKGEARIASPRAISAHHRACEMGNDDSCMQLSYFFGNGYGVEKSDTKAEEFADAARKLRSSRIPAAAVVSGKDFE